jgi:hypothetical protein
MTGTERSNNLINLLLMEENLFENKRPLAGCAGYCVE